MPNSSLFLSLELAWPPRPAEMGVVASLRRMWYKAVSIADRGPFDSAALRSGRQHQSGISDSPANLHSKTWNSPLGGFMEVAELKGAIGELEARMAKIRDWL